MNVLIEVTKETNKLKAYNDELKKLQISKDMEINKLNEQLTSKIQENEVLKKQIDSKIPIDYKEKEKQLTESFEQEKDKLRQKINDLELKIYKATDEKKRIEKESQTKINKLQEEIDLLKQEKEGKEEDQEEEEQSPAEEEEKNEEENNNEDNNQQNEEEGEQKEVSQNEINQDENEEKQENQEIEGGEVKEPEQNENNEEHNSVHEENVDKKEEIENNKNFIPIEQYEELKLSYEKLQDDLNQHKDIKEDLTNQINDLKQAHLKEMKELNNKNDQIVKRKEKLYSKLKESTTESINEKNLKIKELEIKLKTMVNELDLTNKTKTELENIILKQETKVNNLGKKVNQIDQILQKKNAEIKQNEIYAMQLMSIIQEQKTQISVLKQNKKDEQNDELLELQNEIIALKNTIECKYNYKHNFILL